MRVGGWVVGVLFRPSLSLSVSHACTLFLILNILISLPPHFNLNKRKHRQPTINNQLATVHHSIGDVRGVGLFIGVDLVVDRKSLRPATAFASRVATKLKEEHFILTSLDGPGDNVLVMKPPMAFDSQDAERFLNALGQVLDSIQANGGVDEEGGSGGGSATHTPT